MGAVISSSRQGTLRDALKAVAKKHDLRLQNLIVEQIDLTIDDLRQNTPIDTGAAAGTDNGARRAMYRSHPGSGMHIGNAPGDTGWQPSEVVSTRHWAICNPMWGPYLMIVNYTHPTHHNFLENAMRRFYDRMNNLKRADI